MTTIAPFLGALLLAAVVAVTWAARLLPARPAPAVPVAEPVVWLQCDTTTCAHMTMRHDRKPAGLVCRGCGTVAGGAA